MNLPALKVGELNPIGIEAVFADRHGGDFPDRPIRFHLRM